MWHEARKLEKHLRSMMIDHKKRAERRREYYEKIKQDPNQFLQVHGRPCKIHLDPAIAAAAEAPGTMMPWQGNKDNMIDRFDGRAHLDIIPDGPPPNFDEPLDRDEFKEQRHANYERYRILIQNEFLRIPEEKFLRTIELEEKYGGKTYQHLKAREDKKKAEKGKAAIGFVYEDSTSKPEEEEEQEKKEFSDSESESDSDMDLDLNVDITALSTEAQGEINEVGKNYSLGKTDFLKYLGKDVDEVNEMRNAKIQEEERALLAGRKSRRERRLLREQKLKNRKISPPSYAARESPSYSDYRSRSSSRSTTPDTSGKVEFITSFGVDSDDDKTKPVLNVTTVSGAKSGLKRLRDLEREDDISKRRTAASKPVLFGPVMPSQAEPEKKSRRRSRSRSRDRRQRSRSRSRSRRRRSRSRSRDRGRSTSRDVSRRRRRRSSSRNERRKRSRSRTPSRSSRSRARSRSREKTKRRKVSSSSSSTSSSSSEDEAPNRYRSKYRNRKRSSSSSSSNGSRDRLKRPEKTSEPSLFAAVEIVTEDREAARPPSPKPVKRYYGRRVQKSDSEFSLSETEDSKNGSENHDKKSSNTPMPESAVIKEKLRKKMQAQIRKQFKLDKKAEEEKRLREEEERLLREEELREIAQRMKRREKVPGQNQRGSSSDRSSRSPSPEDEPRKKSNGNDEKSRRSPSPKRSRRRSRSRTPSPRRGRRSRSSSRDKKSKYRKRSPSSDRKLKLVDY